jgi:hypothetical protein
MEGGVSAVKIQTSIAILKKLTSAGFKTLSITYKIGVRQTSII